MSKPQYFNPNAFIDDAIVAMDLKNVSALTLKSLREEIEIMLAQRIIDSVVGAMTKKELALFDKLLEDHPELDEIDAIMILAPNIPGAKEKLDAQINSLFQELVHQAKQVDQKLKPVTV
jgi:hypothetical protein